MASVLRPLIFLAALLALCAPIRAAQPLSRDANGFTQFPLAPGARTYYISSTFGADTNDGLAPTRPLKSVDAAKKLLRNEAGDHLLLKAGEKFPPLGNFATSGKSAEFPFLLGVYGDGPRPTVWAWENALGFDGRRHIDNVAIVGIYFHNPWRDPLAPVFNPELQISGKRVVDFDAFALRILTQGSTNILIEDCVFQAFREGPEIYKTDGLTLRRNMFLDAWSAGGKAQGLYIDNCADITIEENLFDHNGWATDAIIAKFPGAGPNIFNHNFYAQSNNRSPITYIGNITARASSHGVQLRTGGVMRDNFFLDNAIAGFCAINPSEITDNVVLGGRDIDASNPRGWGLSILNLTTATLRNNIVAHKHPGVSAGWPYEFQFDKRPFTDATITFDNNRVFDWDTNHVSLPAGVPDTYPLVTGPFLDPARDEKTYAAKLGLPDFLTAARARPRATWDPKLSAAGINTYLRAGFEPKPPAP